VGVGGVSGGVVSDVHVEFRDLTAGGPVEYRVAYEMQAAAVDEVLGDRDGRGAGASVDDPGPDGRVGIVFLLEHEPVVTVSRRAGARDNLIASPELLARHGVAVHETDRGGDVTYHGPGQLVVYPILDLNRLNLGLHAYMRLLEQAVIDACARFGVAAERDSSATGVWVPEIDGAGRAARTAKVCAMGVRVRRWVSMHGLAINVTTNLEHFGLIVPCGLVGRPVTSLQKLLGSACPPMRDVAGALRDSLELHIHAAWREARAKRAAAES
jgi:lipoyl(octanoyl) transferase